MKTSLATVARILSVPLPVTSDEVTGYSIDSRTIRPGELFFAIRGPRFDGHDFVAAVLAGGAAGAVMEREIAGLPAGAPVLRVPSTLAALEKLAGEIRRRWGRRLVAVTGSAGKTTTKEMIAAALATRYRVLKSEGNLNNQYGLPLSLLGLQAAHEVGVFELGMSRAGEITELARIARPDIGVVTCVAPVHLEFFDGLEGIAAAKRELIEALPPGGAAVLNADDRLVSAFADGFPAYALTFGIDCPADFRAREIAEDGLRGMRFRLEWEGEPLEVRVPLLGRHQVLNALAAMAAAHTFGVPPARVAAALRDFRPASMRGEILEANGVTILNDCYNSNPRALDFMLEALGGTPARRRIAVLGEMLELGPASPQLHHQAGRRAAQVADHLVAVRGQARHFLEGAAAAGFDPARQAFFETPAEAGEYVASLVQPGDVVLFKASRGVKLEQALQRMMGAERTTRN